MNLNGRIARLELASKPAGEVRVLLTRADGTWPIADAPAAASPDELQLIECVFPNGVRKIVRRMRGVDITKLRGD